MLDSAVDCLSCPTAQCNPREAMHFRRPACLGTFNLNNDTNEWNENLLDDVENGDPRRQFRQEATFVDQILVVNEDASQFVAKDHLGQILPAVGHFGCPEESAVHAGFAFTLKDSHGKTTILGLIILILP